MAIAATTLWEMQQNATAGNANGGGFNPGNAGMLTDLTTDANTANTNSPVCSSASYNFVAGDVGNWLYIKSGTSWTPGFYKIASVASNKATLTATIGTADQLQNGFYFANTIAGCATVGTPTGGTFTIDYSRSSACIASTAVSDYTAVGASVTMTSATAAFTPVMVGNIFFQSTTGTGAFGVIGRYEIATYVNATTVTLDRTENTGTASVACAGKIGGALSLGSLDDAIFETLVAGNSAYVKFNASVYTLGGAVSISAAGTATAPINIFGYNTQRGDNPTGSTRPTFACGTNPFTLGAFWNVSSIIATGTGATLWTSSTSNNGKYLNVKGINSSSTAGRSAFSSTVSGCSFINCEAISYRGVGITTTQSLSITGCYIHDSNIGVQLTAAGCGPITNNIISACIASAINDSGASAVNTFIIYGNTFMGTTSKRGTGLVLTAGTAFLTLLNNIITGFATGVSLGTGTGSNFDDYNNYFNNTTDVTNWNKGQHDIALDPAFTGVTERTGTTATTTAGNHLVQSGATFVTWGIVAGQDYVYVSGGTGVTAGVYGIASVDSETQITTDIAITANATADKTWFILQGGNFAVGTNMKAAGYPGVFTGGLSTGYLDIGAVQRQEPGGGGSGGSPILQSFIIEGLGPV